MQKPKFNLNPNTSKKEIQKAVNQIVKYVRNKGIQEWRTFHLSTIELNRRYTEEELEKQFNIFFCNGLSHPINKIELAYASYDGLLSIIPVHNDPKSSHESYFNFNTEENLPENPEKHFSDIYKLWNQLKNL